MSKMIGICDIACQQGAPVKAGTQALDVCMNYSGPVTALVGIMTQDFSATQWLRAEGCPSGEVEIQGKCVSCSDDCNCLFPGNVSAVIQCGVWQDEHCQ